MAELCLMPDLLTRNHVAMDLRMNYRLLPGFCCLLAIFVLIQTEGKAQRYLSDYDSAIFERDTVAKVAKRFENLYITAYIQPQYQFAQSKGIESFEGGNFEEHADNRFMLRRARLRFDYRMPGKAGDFPAALFTFQFEATERDVNVRDMFVRIFEPKKHNLALSLGLFSRPFGYEVNLSSSYRETPERGRMSQTLMPSERDLGGMISYESTKQGKSLPIKFDIGLFNGQGKSGPSEFDSYKDLISRLTLRPVSITKNLSFSGGLSYLNGGWYQPTKYRLEIPKGSSGAFNIDSSLSNIGAKAERIYKGADLQLALKHGWGKTEIRGEYWWGTQPGTDETTRNPGTLPDGPTYIRSFDGAFFYLLQNIVNEQWELVAKYDWYDPNTRAVSGDIGASNLTAADIKYATLGFGLTKYFTDNLKILAYYAMVRNEKTALAGYTADLDDNVFTLRMQLRF